MMNPGHAMARESIPAIEGIQSSAVRFELPANAANLAEAHGWLFACMPFGGLAWINPASATPELFVDPSLGSLDLLALPGGRFLLAGRDRQIRILEFARDAEGNSDYSALRVVAEWTGESIPTGLALRGDLLLVSGGGAGLGIYRFHTFREVPRLIGRFPHASYAKEAAFLPGNLAAVTDAHTGSLWVLDLSDPQIPSVAQRIQISGFVDYLSASGNRLAFTDRIYSTRVATVDPEGQPPVTIVQQIPMIEPLRENDFIQRITLQDDLLLVSESHVGFRFFPRDAEGDAHAPGPVLPVQDGAMDALRFTRAGVTVTAWLTLSPAIHFHLAE